MRTINNALHIHLSQEATFQHEKVEEPDFQELGSDDFNPEFSGLKVSDRLAKVV